jgi:hypothetical protein
MSGIGSKFNSVKLNGFEPLTPPCHYSILESIGINDRNCFSALSYFRNQISQIYLFFIDLISNVIIKFHK